MCDGEEAGQHQPRPHDVNLLDGLAPEKADHTEFHNDDLVKLLYPLLADIVHVDGGALQHVHDGCYYIFKSEEILKNVISQYKSRYKFLFFMKYLYYMQRPRPLTTTLVTYHWGTLWRGELSTEDQTRGTQKLPFT